MAETEFVAGMRMTVTRVITAEDIRLFAELSGDKGRHHLEPSADGRLMAHGLLSATLPTVLGGRMNYLARQMHFEFLKAVYSGDTLTCVGTVQSAQRKPMSWRLAFAFEITNQARELVLKGTSSGVVLLGP